MTEGHKDVVVIGAGISGLVCAYRLKAHGLDIALVERSDRVGGVIQSESIDGYLIERGPNSSQGTEELLALVDELGITNEMVEGDPNAPAFVYFNKRLHAVPSGPGAFMKSGLLTLSGKLRILAEPFVRVRHSDCEESVAAFARRRIGREAAERMVAPFVSGIYAGDSERLSVQAAFPRVANLETDYGGLFRGMLAKAREARRAKTAAGAVLDKAAPARRRLVSFRKGMGFLPLSLASRIGGDIFTQAEQLSIVARHDTPSGADDPAGFDVAFTRGGRQCRFSARQVVIATPAGDAARLIAPFSPELSRLLGEIEYPPLAILCLSYDLAAISTQINGFGFLAAPSEGLDVLGCVWSSSLFEGRAPEGKALLTAFIGGARNPGVANLSDDALVRRAHIELQQILGISGEPREVAFTRYDRAIPQYDLGHAARVRRVESLLNAHPGIAIIGNYLHGVSTGDCVKEADRAAREVGGSLLGGRSRQRFAV